MLRDILRFNSRALALANDPHMTLGALLDRLGTGPWFRDYYILPLSGAIWSTPVAGIMDFPAQALVQFFHNHALMQASGQHQWYTVSGGSVEYVRKLQAHLVKTGVDLRLKAPVLSVWREGRRVGLRPEGGAEEWFDEVIFACHSDQALALLVDPSPEERAALGAVRYQSNEIVLHSDTAIMPIRRNVWSSWVYTEAKGQVRFAYIAAAVAAVLAAHNPGPHPACTRGCGWSSRARPSRTPWTASGFWRPVIRRFTTSPGPISVPTCLRTHPDSPFASSRAWHSTGRSP